jgi:hypothetical protein
MITIGNFNVVQIADGEQYGRGGVLTHRGADPLVEFYDNRYMHTERGQFVSRYYRSTLLSSGNYGLLLDGGVPEWQVSAADMALVRAWLKA